MVQFVERLGTAGRRIVVFTAPGDRRDEDMLAMAGNIAGFFDQYICREDDNRRGRAPGEVPALLREALISAGVPADDISIVADEQAAVTAALSEAHAGDLLLIFGDNVARCWEQIVTFQPVHAERRAVRRPSNGQGATVPPDERATPRAYVRDVRGVRLARDLELGD
jgi:cyanophycin synthetase